MFKDLEQRKNQLTRSFVRATVIWFAAWLIVFELWDNELEKIKQS